MAYGKAGKRKEMVKDWCGASCVWKSKCEYCTLCGDKLCVRCVCVCARAEVVTGKEGKTKEDHPCHQVPRLPRKVTIHVTKRHACHAKSHDVHGVNWDPSAPPEPAQCHKGHACHAKWQSMSPSATPATPKAAVSTASTQTQARHQSQPSATSGTSATQSDDPCHQVPRLPRKVKVHVTKRHACNAKSRSVHGVNWDPSAPEPAQCHKYP